MIKNEIFTPIVITTRNDLIDEIEKKTMIIYIEGQAFNDINDEIKAQIKQMKDNKSTGRSLKLIALFAAWLGIVVIPGVGWTIGGTALASILGLWGVAVSNIKGEILQNYLLAYDEIDSKERFVLVRNDYSYKYHSLSDGCILTDNNKCPKCNDNYSKKQMFCNNCKGHIIKISNKKALKNK